MLLMQCIGIVAVVFGHADLGGKVNSVNGIELNVVLSNIRLGFSVEVFC